VLQSIEQRIEDPFLWVRAKITWVENQFDRILTADGFFQRLTLLRTMDKHAPEWLQMFWAKQLVGISPGAAAALAGVKYPRKLATEYGRELGAFYRGVDSPIQGYAHELAAIWRFAARVDESDVSAA
jgi:hypothetical protein